MTALALPGLAEIFDGAQGRLPNASHAVSSTVINASSPLQGRMVRSTYATTNCPIKPKSSWLTMWQWYMKGYVASAASSNFATKVTVSLSGT